MKYVKLFESYFNNLAESNEDLEKEFRKNFDIIKNPTADDLFNSKIEIYGFDLKDKTDFFIEDETKDEIQTLIDLNRFIWGTKKLNNENLHESFKPIKTIEDKENKRKFEFFKTPSGKIEYKVYDWDTVAGEWNNDTTASDDMEWLFAEENSEINAFLATQGIKEK